MTTHRKAIGIVLLCLVTSSPLAGAVRSFLQQGSKLVGSDAVGNFGNFQGQSVSISSDGNIMVTGAPGEGNYVGAAWVWTRNEGRWDEPPIKLVASQPLGASHQGHSVAISANGETIVVGAPYDGDTGAVWLWSKRTGAWTEEAKLVVTDTLGSPIRGHGYSVALSADGNVAVVGNPYEGDGIGAAWLWTRNGQLWSQQPVKLVASDAVGAAQQGYAVSISNDGRTVIVGGYADDDRIGAAW